MQNQKQPPRGVPKERCSENMQQIYSRTPMPKWEITLRNGCSPVNLLHIFRIPFTKNTFGGLVLQNELFLLQLMLSKLTKYE